MKEEDQRDGKLFRKNVLKLRVKVKNRCKGKHEIFETILLERTTKENSLSLWSQIIFEGLHASKGLIRYLCFKEFLGRESWKKIFFLGKSFQEEIFLCER